MQNYFQIKEEKFFKLCVLFSVTLFSEVILAQNQKLSLDAFTEQVLNNHSGLAASSKQSEASRVMESAVDAMTSTQFSSKLSQTSTKQVPESSSVSFDSANQLALEMTFAKQFRSGTKASLGLSWEQKELKNAQLSAALPASDLDFAYFTPSISLSQNLWQNAFGKSFRIQDDLAKAQSSAAMLEYESKKSNVKATAMTAYYRLSFARDRIQIAQKTLENAIKIFEFVNSKYQKNLYEKSDLLQAQALVASRKLELQEAKVELKSASLFFNAQRGESSDQVNEVVESLKDVELSNSAARNWTVETRNELKALESQIQSARFQVELERDKTRPELNLFALASLKSTQGDVSEATSKVMDPSKPQITYGLSISMMLDRDLADMGRRAANLKAEAMKLQADDMKRQMASELESLKTRYEQALISYDIAKNLEEVQKSRVDNEQSEFRNGRSTTYQLLLATQDSAQAELGRLRAAFEIKNILSQLSMY